LAHVDLVYFELEVPEKLNKINSTKPIYEKFRIKLAPLNRHLQDSPAILKEIVTYGFFHWTDTYLEGSSERRIFQE
jgi:hypothetical protein